MKNKKKTMNKNKVDRKDTEDLTEMLKDSLNIGCYNASMGNNERKEIQENWEKEKLKVISCINAFGMGIDKSNVRFVIHTFMTQNMESYHQQTCRASRDGKPASIICYYHPKLCTHAYCRGIQKKTKKKDMFFFDFFGNFFEF